MTVLLKTLQVLLALSVLIFVHELGHYTFARLFHIRVDKFYLFFDIGGKRLFSTRHNRLLNRLFPRLKDASTDYGIGWLPLGGYCKISGMVDESLDTEQLKKAPEPWEFRSHPAWQRLLVMLGGVLFNFIFAIIVYIGLLAHNGTSYIANEESCIYTNALGEQMGFRSGDRILSFDDYVPENFSMLQADLVRRAPSVAKVLRNGRDTVILYVDHSLTGELLNTAGVFDLAIPFVVDTIPAGTPNDGLLVRGDRILSIEGREVPFVQDSRKLLKQYRSMTVTADVCRAGDTLSVPLQVDSSGLLGVYPVIGGIRTKEYTLLEAIPAGVSLTFSNISSYLKDLKLVFQPSTGAYKSVGSFIAIGQVFPSTWDWTAFFSILALLSIVLGVMNLLPIPGLDGGHALITLYEMITGRKPSDRFLYIAQIIGMALLVMLMFLAFGNDIARLIK